MTMKSGWCLTGRCRGSQHKEQCQGTFSYGECPCECHTKEKTQ